MTQKFYQKASVQVAIVSTLGLIVIALLTIAHQRSGLKKDNARLQRETTDKSAEIQRLETLLTPFRTIALERYTGSEQEALAKLASRIAELEVLDQKRTLEVETLKLRLKEAEELAQPATLKLTAHQVEPVEVGLKALLQFTPSKNEALGSLSFKATIIQPETARIVAFGRKNPTVLPRTTIATDARSASQSFSLLGSQKPTIELQITEPCTVLLEGSHITEPMRLTIDIAEQPAQRNN